MFESRHPRARYAWRAVLVVLLVLVGSLLTAAFFYVLASSWVPYRARGTTPGGADPRTNGVSTQAKVSACIAFWIGSVESILASPLFACTSVLGVLGGGLMLVAGWLALGRAPRALPWFALAVAVTIGSGYTRSREFFARAEAALEYRNPNEKKNSCCGDKPNPECLSLTNPCPEGWMQVWRNAAAAWIYRGLGHTAIALGGVGMLSLLLVVSKPAASRAGWECRKCGKVTPRAERRCPKCGAIDCWKAR